VGESPALDFEKNAFGSSLRFLENQCSLSYVMM